MKRLLLFLCLLTASVGRAAPTACDVSLDRTNNLLSVPWCSVSYNSEYWVEWTDDPVTWLHSTVVPLSIAAPFNFAPFSPLVEVNVVDAGDGTAIVIMIVQANQPHQYFRLIEFPN